MRSSVYGWALFGFATLQLSCTFYTACPADNGNANGNTGDNGTAGTGGSSTTGGTDAGGSDAAGGANAAGASGLLDGTWLNATSNLAHQPSECGNLSFGTAKPDEDLLIMSVAQHGLWASQDGGDSWQQLGSEDDPAAIVNRGTSITFDPNDSETWWETGIYNAQGVFKTTDNGATFTAATINHVDFLSIDFSDSRRRTMLASGHEQVHKLYLSNDSGDNWSEIGDFMPEEASVCGFPYVVDANTFLLGCGSYGGGETGVWRSTDAGISWNKVSDIGGGSAPLLASDGTLYWASEGDGGLAKSTDQGETWSDALGKGVIFTPDPSSNPWELPDGRIAELSKESVIVSADAGKTWTPASPQLPFDPAGFFYSAQQKAFFIYHITCGIGTDAVPANGIMRFDFDYKTQ